eukprot:CAMPEP_0175783534 /NCGR_PEP_ID=MMETSP0097-20121207/78352_1 /TAXON_ID=311494 /ORGANISM="Alexandrium monilatum, Strain CCMP3105" /LENGTH=87 /DNA_ID=CAMNT_0017094397 /DNA_START=120 /DNA_END=379 /DNA_ORIENTATION=-
MAHAARSDGLRDRTEVARRGELELDLAGPVEVACRAPGGVLLVVGNCAPQLVVGHAGGCRPLLQPAVQLRRVCLMAVEGRLAEVGET